MKDPLQDNSLGEELALPAGLGEELFVYCPEVLEKLSPNPLDNSEALNAENRRDTATAWEELLKNKLDDCKIMHALAVLWYWTARVEESSEAWLTTMGYWCALTACKDFWSQGKGDEQEGTEAREYVLSELRRGVPTVRLQTELAAVEVMRKAGLHIRHVLLTQGPALLAHLDLTAEVGQVVEELIEQSPEEERFQAVRHIFSPYYSIRVLIDEGEYGQAQTALEELGSEELQLAEVKELQSALFVKQGRRLIKAGNLALGIERWQEAMKLGLSGPELEKLNNEGKKHIIDASGSWPKLGRRDAIIELIESWLKNSEDEALKKELATLLLNRGRSAICAAEDLAVTSSDKADKGIILDTLERGRRDIARAKEIGGNVADGQLKVADRVIAEVRYGVLDLTSQIKGLARAACELMTNNEWDKAIEKILAARALVVSGRPHVLDRFLADCLANKVRTTVDETLISYQEGTVSRQQLRLAIDENSGELLKAQELDLLNNTVERTRQRIDEVIHQTGVSISEEVYQVVAEADKASAANDWDESIRLLLDVFDSVGAKAPRFLKKRLAAVLANRAGAYYDSVRTKTAPEGEGRKLALAAREDLRDAAFFDPENEIILSTLERVESTLLSLPDEVTAPVIEQARTAAESGGWDEAFDVLRQKISQGPRPTPISIQSALADLLHRRASELEPKDRLVFLFEAFLLTPENHAIKAEIERTIHDFALSSQNAETTETALTLAFVHSEKGEWSLAIEPIEASYPHIAFLIKLGRNSEFAVKLGTMAGNEVLQELPILGGQMLEKDLLDPDVKLVETFLETTSRAVSQSECKPLRDELVRLLNLTTPLTGLFEAVDNKDWSQCDKLLKCNRASNTLAGKIINGVHQVILLHQVDLILSSLKKGEADGAQRNTQLNAAKKLLVTASAIETVSPHRVEVMMRSYDETIELLGEDTVAVSTFADDTFWWWFIAITTGAGVITLLYYLAQG